MNPSNDHNNWITVGEVINLIRKPVVSYTDQIVKKGHAKLCSRLKGGCANPIVCEKEKKYKNLCHSCNQWYKELAKWHRNRNKRQIKWRENCDTSKWPVDPWEVAKFFMPILGHNKGTVKDAESTDLSSLLNVLEWMDDVIFSPDKRVDLDLVRKLRSGVRNPWAHSPNQELTDADLNNAFDTANKILADLDIVFSCGEVKKCIEDIKFVQTSGITNIVEAELDALNLLRDELVSQMNGEMNQLKENQISDRQIIKEQLENLEKRISQLQLSNVQETERRAQIKNCIPDKPCTFIGRDAEVNEIISSLTENGCGIVSIVGGPGFGKSTIAIEVSHHLSDNYDIIVIFSYLLSVSTVPGVFLRLCLDVGVNPGEDFMLSFALWLRNIKERVVLVMDNIEQLLEEEIRSEFTELVVTLRKNSQHQLQILTTTRTAFSIPNQRAKNIRIEELDEKSSVELLRTYCPNNEIKDGYLSELANLCGFVPLAMCVAGSLIEDLDDPFELIQWLKVEPMKALQSADESQCVRKAIEVSFKMLTNVDKKAFARLSVFNGNFQKKSAQEIIERDGLETQKFLNKLVARSLIKRRSDKRFVILSLIRRFLTDHDELQDEKAIGEGLMVRHFLKLCHLWTMKSCSKDGFTVARELLKKDGHNVEETFKICSHDQAKNLKSNIIESLESSDIYKSSSRLFYNFGWDLLPLTVLRNFHESCIKLAEGREQLAIQITFQCLVADQEGRRTAWKSSEYIGRMEAIKEAFDKNNAVLKEDRSLYSYCYYFYARYYSIKTNELYPDLQDEITAMPENMNRSSIEKIDEVLVLIERGHLNKRRATKIFHSDREKYEEYMKSAELVCNQALSSAIELLGEHELTCICHKVLGDLYFTWRKNEEALTYYSDAIQLRKKLKLDSNEPFVYLLKNFGSCLSILRRFEASVENLNEARDIVDKLAEKHTPFRAKVYYALAKTYRAWKPHCQESVKYAKMAMEMHVLLDPRSVKLLEDIIKTAEECMER
ncbi:WD repeat-containing alr2800 [Paramuricea clavata]|uniref:WD repeat-containing alr2800 n=1 Tax=Paramuricea clavata TaxID=317549 RepID=A0A6S7LBW3_PARCT|nr:WD repeat-containing alr2800 [Paramuricea clavata]